MYRTVRVASAMRLVSEATVETIDKGESLVQQGDQSDALFCVLDGSFDVYIDSGGQDLRVASVGAGEVLGELGLLNSARRSATVRDTADVSSVSSASNVSPSWTTWTASPRASCGRCLSASDPSPQQTK